MSSYGYDTEAAPEGAWRDYDADNPDPGYFEFDSLSSRHPDLYHAYAESTVGLMEELPRVVDVKGLEVVDVGAGTGRSTHALARLAKKVVAIDPFRSVIAYNARVARDLGLTNIEYPEGDRSSIPLDDDSVDALACAWAILDVQEAARVVKPGGLLMQMGAVPERIAGELSPIVFGIDPESIPPIDVAAEPTDTTRETPDWDGVPTLSGVHDHDFTYVASYDSPEEAAAMCGRIYGPAVRAYMAGRNQRTVAWSLRITWARLGTA